MTTITLTGQLGPLDALELRDDLDRATTELRPQIVIDMSDVESVHPAVVAAIVRASGRARRLAGTVRVVQPLADAAARTARLVSLNDLLR